MKAIIYKTATFLILLFFNQRLLAQEGFIIDSVEFCSINIAIPDTCTAETKRSVKGKNWSIEWNYYDKGRFPSTRKFYSGFMKTMGYKFKEKKAEFLILNKRVSGTIVTFKSENEENYSIYASMLVNKQIVVIFLSLNQYPVNNSSLPDFAKEIIQFKQ
ncbi:hypothetical protein LQ567_06140 [Niabella pedocola]|uniref:DUF3805 domain-containing protein n=1 Tax=Niabella pedocola TaxID=1752077 RepID=A0ABS8PNA4_9BACT|nr:hypothetical protein [Niabella pedocola]MCD2422335.1 hypothetical protein [Niabella pedocola]